MGCNVKKTKVKLELVTDIDKINFIESSIRSGISTICHKRV